MVLLYSQLIKEKGKIVNNLIPFRVGGFTSLVKN